MSLLIKALQKAEQEKTAEDKTSASDGLSLELAPVHITAPESDLDNETDFSPSQTSALPPIQNQKQVHQQAAATMFAAKSVPTNKAGLSKSSLLAGAVVFLLLLLCGGFYFYLNSLNQPELMLPKQAAASPAAAQPIVSQEVAEAADPAGQAPAVAEIQPDSAKDILPQAIEKAPAKSYNSAAFNTRKETSSEYNERSNVTEAPVRKSERNPPRRSQQLTFGEAIETGGDMPMTVTRNQAAVGINPDLVSAYAAFRAGNDTAAQRYYRQVLHGDVRSVDALLGMAAIAARQGRSNDALGWYGKVLEVEPRNAVAQSAMVSVMAQADPIGSESRIKNLLAQQPEAAYLHAALGSMYAGQNQWPLAQQSYFQALHFDAKNAEYAFNLAVSLDHLGKTVLALQYYKTTLELLAKSGTGNIDRTQVEARIAQLE
jgi:tetratricopeptide (TPR) repeat protein